jgi:hypothetical protein
LVVLVALLHACKQSSDRALARRVLSGFEHLRKAFKELSVPHSRSIQAQILNPESLTPNKSHLLNPSLCPSIQDLLTFISVQCAKKAPQFPTVNPVSTRTSCFDEIRLLIACVLSLAAKTASVLDLYIDYIDAGICGQLDYAL